MKNLFFALSLIAMSLFFVNCGGGTDGEATDKQDSTAVDSSDAAEPTEAPEEAEKAKNIVGLAQETEALSTLVKALQAADLVSALEGEGPFTVFAPTNEAFAALGTTLDDLLKPENKEKLAGILKYHVVSGMLKSTDLKDGQKAATLNGAEVTISTKDGVSLNGKAKVTMADVEASNGVVHIIDTVILPPGN
ncbi:MAG: hypothetical protein OHK0053_24920 [Microscillaceae bacterium]